jgi:hypothetical protein
MSHGSGHASISRCPEPVKKRIAILAHERASPETLRSYQISTLARHWIEDGHEVILVAGARKFVPADIAILHIDLSVVPEPYLALARQYPRVLNGRLADIRKSVFATNLLARGDAYGGPVFVKSNLNRKGFPEAALAKAEGRNVPVFGDYRVYSSLAKVPAEAFDNEGVVVQKFQPEMDGNLFCVRYLAVMGRYAEATRLRSTQPVVNGDSCLPDIETVEPDTSILALRERLGLDYGKMDYVVVDGKAILLDVNKTVGAGAMSTDPAMLALRRKRARGLYSYFEAG